VIPPTSGDYTPTRIVPSLVKAVARAHSWHERIINGDIKDQRSIATETGLDERYVSRVFQSAFLAPDIVEAILDGRQPPDLTFNKMLNRLPMDWAEQHKQLGFVPK